MEIAKGVRFASKLSLKILEGAIEGLINGVVNAIGEEKLSVLIENDRDILACIFSGMIRPPVDYYQRIPLEEAQKIERIRRSMAKTVLPVLGMARTMASKFPSEAVEKKITAEWLMSKGEKKFPKLVEVVKAHGEKGRRWVERQADQIRDFMLGRITFDPNTMQIVPSESVEGAEKEGTLQQG